MAKIRIPRGWEIPEREVTPRSVYANRRQLLKSLGVTAGAAIAGGCGIGVEGLDLNTDGTVESGPLATPRTDVFDLYLQDAMNNPTYEVRERALTDFTSAASFNNYYEYTTTKSRVWELVGVFEPDPWTVRVHGLVENELTLGLEDLAQRFEIEERIYRHRCVERWAMTVPWNGFPLRALLAQAQPLSSARYVRFTTLSRPSQQPGLDAFRGDWPYYEALTIEEAELDLAFLVVGMYGEALPAQNGSPLRLALPWKYGYKSIKAIVDIELVEEQPPTFWNDVRPDEYGFYSNVDPNVPHPRWSQAREWLIPNTEDVVDTQLYNGYADFVSSIYTGDEY